MDDGIHIPFLKDDKKENELLSLFLHYKRKYHKISLKTRKIIILWMNISKIYIGKNNYEVKKKL